MDLNNLLHTFILFNLKTENSGFLTLFLVGVVLYLINNYYDVYYHYTNLYDKYIFKKCSVDMEMVMQKYSCYPHTKVLGVLFKMQEMNLDISHIEDVPCDIEMKDTEKSFSELNNSHFIPITKGLKLKDDLFIDISLEDNSNKKDKKDDEDNKSYNEKIIKMKLYTYKRNINYVKKFIEECEMDYLKFLRRNQDRVNIFTSFLINDERVDYLKFNRFKFNSYKTFDNLFFEGKELILTRIKNYENLEQYKHLGIPHTLGFLFYGEPGTGKTSTIKAIANYTNRTIISVNMNHIKSINEFVNLFNNMYIKGVEIPFEKRLYVFEEIDNYTFFQTRENDNKKKNDKVETPKNITDVLGLIGEKKEPDFKETLSVGQVLEVLDGIIECEDRFCIFTTNHIEKIDKAFLRPGRIDNIIEFKKLRKVDMEKLFSIWFNMKIPDRYRNMLKDYIITQAEFGKLCFENMNEPMKVIEKLIK